MRFGMRQKPVNLLLGCLFFLLAGCVQVKPGPNTVVIDLNVDQSIILPGECAQLNWEVQGGFGVELNGEQVPSDGLRQVCPLETTTYTLRVDTGEEIAEASVVIMVSDEGQSSPDQPEESPTAQQSSGQITIERDLQFGAYTLGGQEHTLLLDLYLPVSDTPVPVLVYIHGGGWIEGSKQNCPGNAFAEHGYAVACLDYRLAPLEGGCPAELTFPVQIQDVKAAVRWLRTNSDQYGLDPNHFGAIGESSGGHLASLLGTSAGEPEFEEDQSLNISDAVQAVVDWYGPVDVTQPPPDIVFTDDPCTTGHNMLSDKYGGESTPYFYWTYAWAAFLGGSLTDTNIMQQAWKASPLAYVDASDPPFLIIHGEKDGMIPIQQSALLAAALQNAGTEVTFLRLPEAGHNYCDRGDGCQEVFPEFLEPTLEFFDQHLK